MENQIEIWKPVKNFEGFYEVSSLGRVRSLSRVVKTGFAIYNLKPRILNIKKNN